jgi:hypothetical protein
LKTQARRVLEKLAATGAVDRNDIPRLAAPLDRFVNEGFRQADQHFTAAFTQLAIASASPPPKDRLAQLFSAQKELDAGYAAIEQAQAQVSHDLREQIRVVEEFLSRAPGAGTQSDRAAKQSALEEAKEATARTDKIVQGIIGDRGILDDPLASSVVYAPESYWRRPQAPHGINETYAAGNWGNTDIAVKMESVGDFTIKGVRLDASKITQATFAVTRQAVKTVAALYGIPTGGAPGSAPAPSAPFDETSIAFTSPDERRAAADEAYLRRRMARMSVMETILIQRDALTNPATTTDAEAARAVAIATVKATFAANRSDLDGTADQK